MEFIEQYFNSSYRHAYAMLSLLSNIKESELKQFMIEGKINIITNRYGGATINVEFIESNIKSDDKKNRLETQTINKINILFLSANPSDTTRLRLDEEMRSIDQAIIKSDLRDVVKIEQQWAVKVTDLQEHLMRYKPNIVHFSGHGSESNKIILEDDQGKSHPVTANALRNLFRSFKDKIRCVVLNACYSEDQAKSIAQHIDCVIGMSKTIGDKAAISFSTSFYRALSYGKNFQTSFDLACNQLELLNLPDHETPILITLDKSANKIKLK